MKLRKWTKPEATYALGAIVFVPTLAWYGLIIVQKQILGFFGYLAFVGFAYIGGGFDFYSEWPRSAKMTLWAGPPLLLVGLLLGYLFVDLHKFRAQDQWVTAWILVGTPMLLYGAIFIMANHKLRCKFGMSAGDHILPPKSPKAERTNRSE